MKISESAAETNVGRKRRHNEDNYVAEPPVFAVADGMGGAQAGEVASALAAGAVTDTVLDPASTGEERVVALIKAANLRVHQRANADASASGMGTTMTVAMLQSDGSVAIGHVGDSRAYRLRGAYLEQLTDDHSLVAELVRRGELSPEEAAVHPQRSVITRALGTEADVDVDAFTVETQHGDVFLLCSDGLTTMVDTRTIADILQRHRDRLDAATHHLIKAANDRGGDDNITAVLFAVADGEPEQTQTLPAAGTPHDPDDEDTLHPEDGVRLPDAIVELPRQRDITMIVSASELARALGQATAPAELDEAAVEPAYEAPERDRYATDPLGRALGDTLPAAHVETTPAGGWPALSAEDAAVIDTGEAAHDGDERAGPEEERASAFRIFVAGLVIVALAVVIVWLVLDALPR